MFGRKRIYILVKTYPTISEKYTELVCTAGVLEDGSWVRLYPVPFRLLEDDQKFQKYTWVWVDVTRNTSDPRPESFRPDTTTIEVEGRPKKADWDERRRVIFNNQEIYTNLQKLIDKARSDSTSLAVFKPTKVVDLVVEPTEREWDPRKLTRLKSRLQQLSFLKPFEEIIAEFRVVPKVPYTFSYRFEDDSGRVSELMITDWEIGMLYFNCLRQERGDEKAAIAKVREKYLDMTVKRDLYFFLGTTRQYHGIALNPFIIVGVFYPPKSQQLSFF
ncbi:MAG: hypothetical protein ACOX18_00420 [Bacillota bacterium]|jgi:hypothetical protein